jgi:pimeloyl-ACP methyl ester carboxylesterase
MAEFIQGDVRINGIKIHYYRSGGKKPPFILLHGATDNGLCWTPIAAVLAERYDVIMPDAQGHGLSDRLDPKFSYESHTKQTAGLIKELGLKKPIVMGHSMGAGTTTNIAAEYPLLPKAIILEDPAWGMQAPPNPEEAKKQQEFFRTYLTGIAQRPLEEIVKESRKNDPTWAEEERIPWAIAKQQFDKNLFATMVINPHSYEELVPKIKCPTLLIIAEKGIVSKETAEKAAKLWKSKKPFKWVYIKGAGHNIRREQFAAFKKALLEFLEEIG